MRNVLLASLVILAASCITPQARPHSSAPPGSISGRITREGAPIEGAIISRVPLTPGIIVSSQGYGTDPEGWYVTPRMEAGRYRLEVFIDGRLVAASEITTDGQRPMRLDFAITE